MSITWTKWGELSKLPWTKIVQKSKYNKTKLRYLPLTERLLVFPGWLKWHLSSSAIVGTIHQRRIKGWLQKKKPSPCTSTRSAINLRMIDKSCSLAPQNPSQLHDNHSLINKHLTFTLHHDCKHAGLLRDVNIQCSTCYGRDGTIASRSINTEGETAALVLTRKQKAIAQLAVNSFQQGGPGFQVRILLTFTVTLFDQPLA